MWEGNREPDTFALHPYPTLTYPYPTLSYPILPYPALSNPTLLFLLYNPCLSYPTHLLAFLPPFLYPNLLHLPPLATASPTTPCPYHPLSLPHPAVPAHRHFPSFFIHFSTTAGGGGGRRGGGGGGGKWIDF